VEGGLGGVVVGHEPELGEQPGAGGAVVAQGVVDVAGDVERPGVAGHHIDDRAQDLGLARGRPARPGGPAVLGDHQGQVAEAGRGQPAAAVCLEQRLDGRFQAGGRDRPEHVGEEVQADVVEVGDERPATCLGEFGEEAAARAEQR